jgi:WavE lipopolysaccharide synthesis
VTSRDAIKNWLYNPQASETRAEESEAGHDVTIVIQGRLARRGIENIPTYERFGRVILSCWDSCDKSLLTGVDLPRIQVVITAKPEEGKYFNYGNAFLQTLSTLHGVMHAKTPWALKVRCDEFYTDLSAFIGRMKAQPAKLITNNVFFRKDAMYKYHVSDHVIGGRTENLRETFRIMRDRCMALGENRPREPKTAGWMPTESLIATSYLRHVGIAAEPARSKELMRTWFDLVRVSEMGKFYCAFNNAGTGFEREEDILKSDSIASMEDL